jgi:hypothetical protein
MDDGIKPRIDLKDAELILQQAKTHLDKGESVKAMQTAKKANKTVDRTVDSFHDAISAVENLRRVIDDARAAGVKTGEADELLGKANSALISGSYSDVHAMTRRGYNALQSASFLPGRDLAVNTKVEYDQGRTTLAIRLENNTDFTIRHLKIRPDLKDTPFLQEGEKSVPIKPNKEEKVIYDLTATTLPGADSDERLVFGRDITVETSLRSITKENRIIYVVWVTNNTPEALLNLKVSPKIPEALVPDSPEKSIDQILPSEKKQIVFELSVKQ